jgi:putative tricarboxylic transport membrane protein
MFKKRLVFLSLIVVLVIGLGGCNPNAYPNKPLEIIAPAGAGGGWDTLARTISATLEAERIYPQAVTVTNQSGGGGGVGLSYISAKKGDDYELIVYSPPAIILTLNKTFPESYKILTPLAKLITDYQIVLVKADSPYKTLTDLLNAIQKNAAEVKLGGGSAAGSMDHLSFAKIASAAGLDPKNLVYVAFSGGGEAITALLDNQVAFVTTGTGESLAQVQAGKVRALAVTSAERLGGALKDVPTVRESGYNATYEVWRGVFGAPGMSKEAQDWWAGRLKTMTETQTWKDALAKLQWQPAYADAVTFTRFLADEEVSYRTLMGNLGFLK